MSVINKIPSQIKNTIGKGVEPTKIDLKTGKGVPGGFTAENVKIPKVEAAKLTAAAAAVGAQAAKVTSLMKNPLSAPVLAPIKSKLTATAAKYTKKAKDVAKSAYNYKAPAGIPKLPSVPNIKVPELNLPPLPAVPTIALPQSPISVPTLPSLPSVSSIKLPSASLLSPVKSVTSLAAVKTPTLPSLPTIPTV